MSDRYKGAILSPTAPTVTPQSAGGIYTSSQQLQYQGQGVWPTAANNPLTNSLRFRSSASARLTRTPASAGNRQIWTWSGWVKLGSLSVSRQFFGTTGGATQDAILFNADNQLVVFSENASQTLLRTAQLFRDPSAWYHLVVAVDTTQATAANRVKIYVNGVQVTAFEYTQYPSQNFQGSINNNVIHYISTYDGSAWAFDGYLAEVNFVNAVQLTPSSFGTTDAYGIWQPIPYTGAYGTNGFYLPFTDNSALTTSSNVGLGKDFSGNGNYWTTNNISITAGSTYDSMKDVPTNTNSNTANYCVINPLQIANPVVAYSISNGNLQLNSNSGSTYNCFANGTIFPTTGKWYAEFTQISGTRVFAGISRFTDISTPNNWNASSTYYINTGEIQKDGSTVVTGATWTTGDVIGVAYDADAATCAFYKNNSLQGTVSGVTAGTYSFSVNGYQSGVIAANFGQQPFAYTPPSGFYPLNTYNLSTPTILAGDDYFNTVLYFGNGGTQTVSGVGFEPGLVWNKSRGSGNNNCLNDVLRGAGNTLFSDDPSSTANLTSYFTAFTSDGYSFALGGGAFNAAYNYVAWNWRANGAGVSNTNGTITSTISANTTSGFSIVTYTGTGANATVGHGLGVAPAMVIVKSRSDAYNWQGYHISLGKDYTIKLNTTQAQENLSDYWGSGGVTSTVFGINGSYSGINANGGTYVAYCFAPVAGYSAFGSYTGNGSTDGPFIYTGFRPRFVLIKLSSAAGANWEIYDSARNTYNATDLLLLPSSSSAEGTFGSYPIDLLSNGFKVRGTGSGLNDSGQTLIYACFAENPFKISRAR